MWTIYLIFVFPPTDTEPIHNVENKVVKTEKETEQIKIDEEKQKLDEEAEKKRQEFVREWDKGKSKSKFYFHTSDL